MKVKSTMSFAIVDLVFKLFSNGPSMSKTPTLATSPSPSITSPTQNKVEKHIQRHMDVMGLRDCVQKM